MVDTENTGEAMTDWIPPCYHLRSFLESGCDILGVFECIGAVIDGKSKLAAVNLIKRDTQCLAELFGFPPGYVIAAHEQHAEFIAAQTADDIRTAHMVDEHIADFAIVALATDLP